MIAWDMRARSSLLHTFIRSSSLTVDEPVRWSPNRASAQLSRCPARIAKARIPADNSRGMLVLNQDKAAMQRLTTYVLWRSSEAFHRFHKSFLSLPF